MHPTAGLSEPELGDGLERTLAEQLFKRISEAIIQGEIPAGSKISEPALSRQYGVSRGPLREALHRLQERRLVTRIAHVGPRVTTLSANILQEVFIVREALEGMAAREAARNATPEEISAIRTMHENYRGEFPQRNGSSASYTRSSADVDFHFLVAKASHNPTLITLLCSDLDLLLRFYRSHLRNLVGRVQRVFVEHERIVEAIEEGDAEMAELHMRRHIAAARVALSALVGEFEQDEQQKQADQ